MKGLLILSDDQKVVLSVSELLAKKAVEFNSVRAMELVSEAELLQMAQNANYDTLIERVLDNMFEKHAPFTILNGVSLPDHPYLAAHINMLLAVNSGLTVWTEEQNDLAFLFKEKGVRLVVSSLADAIDEAMKNESTYISPKFFEGQLAHMASVLNRRIVLPEGDCDRVLAAVGQITSRKIAQIILLGDVGAIREKASKMGVDLDGVDILNPATSDKTPGYAQKLFELRQAKGMTLEQANETILDSSYFGTMMVYMGDADGMVSGAEHTTAHTIRPALQFIKTKPGLSVVSGSFIMSFKGKNYIFADCGVTPNPTPEQLSEIAVASAQTARMIGLDPRVAFLSYATGSSAEGPSIDAVKKAIDVTRALAPDLVIDGPIQFDAAIDVDVAKTKLPASPVAGRANVFVFPDLNAGNCCYKAVQRAADQSLALGPLLQGLKKPINDLSRGSTVADIINTVAVTALFSKEI